MAKSKPETYLISLDAIEIGDQKIRETPEDDSIGELAESIASKGLLQPIGVTPLPDGRYQLRWGHRRVLAHRRLGEAKIKATVYDGDERSIKGLALVENLHRSQMTMADEVDTVLYLANDEGKSVEQIAAIVNKSRSWVLNRLMIPELPEFLQTPLMAGDLPISHVELISKVPDPGAQQYLTSMAIQHRWNRSQLKTIADCYMMPAAEQPATAPNTPGVNPNPVISPFMYVCEMCQEKGTLEQFTLVRIHKDGLGCRATIDRSNHQSNSIDEMDSRPSRHQRTDDQATD